MEKHEKARRVSLWKYFYWFILFFNYDRLMANSSNSQKQYSERELTALASQVTEGLELWVSEHIWRTSLRIFEIMRGENPIMARYNPFLQDFRRFMTLLTGHTFSGLLAQSRVHDILVSSERFEEGEAHPLIYADVIWYGEQLRLGIFLEIHFHELYDQWLSFTEIIQKLSTIMVHFPQAISRMGLS